LTAPRTAVVASILTAIYYMLKDGTMYQDLGCDHFKCHSADQQKNRLAKRLSEFGYAVELKPPRCIACGTARVVVARVLSGNREGRRVQSECPFHPGDGEFRHGSIATSAEPNVDVRASRGRAMKVLVDHPH
jgi:hypothetical protein